MALVYLLQFADPNLSSFPEVPGELGLMAHSRVCSLDALYYFSPFPGLFTYIPGSSSKNATCLRSPSRFLLCSSISHQTGKLGFLLPFLPRGTEHGYLEQVSSGNHIAQHLDPYPQTHHIHQASELLTLIPFPLRCLSEGSCLLGDTDIVS